VRIASRDYIENKRARDIHDQINRMGNVLSVPQVLLQKCLYFEHLPARSSQTGGNGSLQLHRPRAVNRRGEAALQVTVE
jgi:hypothetical protein